MTKGLNPKVASNAAMRFENGRNVLADGKSLNNSKGSSEDRVMGEMNRHEIERLWKGIVEMPTDWDNMSVRAQRDWSFHQVDRHLTNVPKNLQFFVVGFAAKGDYSSSGAAPIPDWLDREKFQRGQRFAANNLVGVFLAEVLSLFGIYAFQDPLRPMIVSGRSSEPFTSYKRYESTANRVASWFTSDPWTVGTPAYKNMQTVRKMHAMARDRMLAMSDEEITRSAKIEDTWSTTRSVISEDFRDSCPAAPVGQCPYAFAGDDQPYMNSKGLSQAEMAMVQSSFVNYVILCPENLGIHGTSDDDLEAFCHMWRGLGYLLGIEDEFNFCNGTLQEIRSRARNFMEYWVKPNMRDITPEYEHMMRSLTTGIGYYFLPVPYEYWALYHAELLNVRLPRLEAALGYWNCLYYTFIRFVIQKLGRLPLLPATLNRFYRYSLERGRNRSEKELQALKKHSAVLVTKGIAETAAVQNDLSTLSYWHKNSYLVILSTFLLVTLPFAANECAKMFLFSDAGSVLTA